MSSEYTEFTVPEPVELWGELKEFPPRPRPDLSMLSTVIEEGFVKEPPRVKRPVAKEQHISDPFVLGIENGSTIDMIRHTIMLHQHSKIMEKNLKDIEKVIDANVPKYPEFPKMTVSEKENDSDKQQKIDPASLTAENIQEMMEIAVATILAHVGFEKTSRSVILTLVDVVKGFLTRINRITHLLAQRDLNEGKVGYKDVLDKAFKAVGFSGLNCLKDYVKQGIIDQQKTASDKSALCIELYKKKAEKMFLNQNNVLGQGGYSSIRMEALLENLIIPQKDWTKNIGKSVKTVDSDAGPSGVGRPSKRKKPPGSAGPIRAVKEPKKETQ